MCVQRIPCSTDIVGCIMVEQRQTGQSHTSSFDTARLTRHVPLRGILTRMCALLYPLPVLNTQAFRVSHRPVHSDVPWLRPLPGLLLRCRRALHAPQGRGEPQQVRPFQQHRHLHRAMHGRRGQRIGDLFLVSLRQRNTAPPGKPRTVHAPVHLPGQQT